MQNNNNTPDPNQNLHNSDPAKPPRPDDLLGNISLERKLELLSAIKRDSYRTVLERISRPESEGGWNLKTSPATLSRFVRQNGHLLTDEKLLVQNDIVHGLESTGGFNPDRMRKVALIKLQQGICEPAILGALPPEQLPEVLKLLLQIQSTELATRRVVLEEQKIHLKRQNPTRPALENS